MTAIARSARQLGTEQDFIHQKPKLLDRIADKLHLPLHGRSSPTLKLTSGNASASSLEPSTSGSEFTPRADHSGSVPAISGARLAAHSSTLLEPTDSGTPTPSNRAIPGPSTSGCEPTIHDQSRSTSGMSAAGSAAPGSSSTSLGRTRSDTSPSFGQPTIALGALQPESTLDAHANQSDFPPPVSGVEPPRRRNLFTSLLPPARVSSVKPALPDDDPFNLLINPASPEHGVAWDSIASSLEVIEKFSDALPPLKLAASAVLVVVNRVTVSISFFSFSVQVVNYYSIDNKGCHCQFLPAFWKACSIEFSFGELT